MRYEIARVWGKADSFDIEFTHKGGAKWSASVPPDFKDGVYATEIWALNVFGERAYWAGELFMCNGVCCIEIEQSSCQLWLMPRSYQLEFMQRFYMFVSQRSEHSFALLDRRIFTVRKGCSHVW